MMLSAMINHIKKAFMNNMQRYFEDKQIKCKGKLLPLERTQPCNYSTGRHTHTPLSITRYSFIQLSKQRQCGKNTIIVQVLKKQ